MAMVNMNNLINGKDSRWLQLEVCREFQRNKCTRPDTECKFAHPPPNVEVQNGKVTACYDSIKGRCNREKPPCKYFHPPQHLKDQLLINGRNHLALKNALLQQMGISPGQPMVTGQVSAAVTNNVGRVVSADLLDLGGKTPNLSYFPAQFNPALSLGLPAPFMATNPYLGGLQQVGSTYSPFFTPGHMMPTLVGPDPNVGSPLGVVPQTIVPQKLPRSDRLEVCREYLRGACKRAAGECRFAHPPESVAANEDGSVTVCMDFVKGRCARDPCRYLHPPLHLQAHVKAAQSRPTATLTLAPVAPPTLTSAAGAAPGEVGRKRAHDPTDHLLLMDMKSPVGSFYYESFAFPGMLPYKRPAGDKSGVPVYQPGAYQQLMQPYVPVSSLAGLGNAPFVVYTDHHGQLLDTLPVCQDFSRSRACPRPTCQLVHLDTEHVETNDGRVTVCRDAAKGACFRPQCKFYHIPVALPPAGELARAASSS